MIDYFYQLDYDDRPQSPVAAENGIDEGPQEVPPEPVPEPSSPVADTIGFYEELSAPPAALAEEASNDLAVRKNYTRGKKRKDMRLDRQSPSHMTRSLLPMVLLLLLRSRRPS
jgi:hypothetical protein